MRSPGVPTNPTPAHLVLLTSAFPFGTREEFLEDELPTLASRFARVTIVTEAASGAARALPVNCEVVGVAEGDATPRWLLLLLASRRFVGEPRQGASWRKRVHMFRAILYYLRKASAITHATQRHLERSVDALPLCFYSYWMDHKSLAATELANLHRGSIAVSRTHGYDLYPDRHPHHYLPLRGPIATRLTAIFPVSDNGAHELRRHVPAGANIITARLGVLPSEALPEPEVVLGTDRPVVVSVGSLIPLKRIGLLIEALTSMAAQGISWWHFGEGPLRESLTRQAAEKLRIPHTFHGYVPHRDLRLRLQHVARHAVLVSTSASEGIPVSMMEAMAEGIPCIGTRVGGVDELVIDGVNGYLLPSTPEPEEVRDTLQRFLALSVREQTAMRRAAFETWSSRFHATKNYASFADQLHRMLPCS